MAHNSNHHHHDHEHDLQFERVDGSPDAGRPDNPAMESLADALRVSFRLLGLIMVVFVILFLATGIDSIEPQQKGVIKRLGRVVGVAEPGFTYNWPFPIGEIVKVSSEEKSVSVEKFWLAEPANEVGKALAERRVPEEGLRPEQNGYLMTADRNLIHIRFEAKYRIQNPVAVLSNVQVVGSDYSAVEDVIRQELASAAIRAAATRTADALQQDHTGFFQDVQQYAQERLDRLMGTPSGGTEAPGVQVMAVLLSDSPAKTWPLAAMSAYQESQQASSERQRLIDEAIGKAQETLVGVIGPELFPVLVGDPVKRAGLGNLGVADRIDGDNTNLIGQYESLANKIDAARDVLPQAKDAERDTLESAIAKMDAQQTELLTRIDEVLTSVQAGGDVKKRIKAAEPAYTAAVETARQRAENFRRRLAAYRENPSVFLAFEWNDVLRKILDQPASAKYLLPVGSEKMVIRLNPSPVIRKRIRDYQRREAKGLSTP